MERLRTAISQIEEHGLLGYNISGSGFSFEIEIKQGAGAFVRGEETALIASVEGKWGDAYPSSAIPGHLRTAEEGLSVGQGKHILLKLSNA